MRRLHDIIGCLVFMSIPFWFVVCLQGCATFQPKTYVLTETESYYYIPPNTSFNAQLVKDGPIVEVRRVQPTWAVDAGYLAKLQEAANAAVIKPK